MPMCLTGSSYLSSQQQYPYQEKLFFLWISCKRLLSIPQESRTGQTMMQCYIAKVCDMVEEAWTNTDEEQLQPYQCNHKMFYCHTGCGSI